MYNCTYTIAVLFFPIFSFSETLLLNLITVLELLSKIEFVFTIRPQETILTLDFSTFWSLR